MDKSDFLTVKYRNQENLVFQHITVKESYTTLEKNRLVGINRCRNGINNNTLSSVDNVGIVKIGGVNIEVFEGFFGHKMQYIPYTNFVIKIFAQRDL